MTAIPGGVRHAANPHGPVLGLSHRLLGRFHVTGVFWYKFPFWAATRLPSWVQGISVVVFTAVFFCALGRIRRAVWRNLDPVLGASNVWTRNRRSLRTMYEFARCLNERYIGVSEPERLRFVLDGEEHWQEVLASGAGVILVTAHIGPWESASWFGASAAGRRVHVVREKESNPEAQAFIHQMLSGGGEDYVTHFAGEDMALGIVLAEALKRGDIVALQGDRPRSGGRSLETTFFGRTMSLPSGPSALARATGALIVPVFNFREGPLLVRSVVRPAIHVPRTSNREADIADAVGQLALNIEWAIRSRPHQWFCFRQLWDSQKPAPSSFLRAS